MTVAEMSEGRAFIHAAWTLLQDNIERLKYKKSIMLY
jgi:hypothetical protein